jgi:cobalt-zinc-cadmium efflux system protein
MSGDHSGHAHQHGHSHSHVPSGVSESVMGAAVILTVAFVAVEAASGWWAHSLALLSDAGHNMADAAALGLSWYALRAARKPSHAGMTFGYHRVGIFAALANAAALVAIAVLIAVEAIARIREPEVANGSVMIGVAAAAIAVNLLIGLWLHKGSKDDLNIRSAYLHMLGDAFSALGVVVAGAIIEVTGAAMVDPIASLLIAGLILWTSWETLAETVNVLLEAAPRGLDMAEIEQAIRAVPGIHGTHHLHVWTVASGMIACSCHIIVAEQSVRSGQQVLRAVVETLEHRFGISHATVQVEVEGCGPDGSTCAPNHS